MAHHHRHHQEDHAEDEEAERLHIVMFPWLAFGHLIPFLELSKCLAAKGHLVSFISTPRNLQRLPKIPPNLASNLNFVSIPLPHVDNLPDQAESTLDLPLDHVPYLKLAYDALHTPLSSFLETSTPDWIIYDFAPHWLPPIASRLGISSVYFSIFNASFNAFMGTDPSGAGRSTPEQFTVLPDWIPFPSNLAFRMYEILKLEPNLEQNLSGVTDVFRLVSSMNGSDCMAVRSCMEIESEWFNLLQEKLLRKPVLPVGLLPPTTHIGEEKREEWVKISEWLDKQEKGSVVYVALGTEATLSREELTELALGLEESELPFFWVLRRPAGSSVDPTDLLPVGFKDRITSGTGHRGFICMGWAPQPRILGHPSVGVFLTHCGWGSIVEGLVYGSPLILLPFIHDQALNSRLLVWKEMGLEIERNEEDGGSFTRETVAKSLRKVIVEEEGERSRGKARELRDVLGDESRNDRYVEDFARYLTDHRRRVSGAHTLPGTTVIDG